MHRWHESGCQQPDVIYTNGTPRCSSCSFQLIQEGTGADVTPMPPIPRLESRSQLNLTWPLAVKYTNSKTCSNGVDVPSSPEAKNSQGSLLIGKSKSLGSFPDAIAEGDIRLLRLRPNQDNGPIHGDIDLLSLKDAQPPSYIALSYAAFDGHDDPPTKSYPVYVGRYWDVIYVTKNCEDALRAIRQHDQQSIDDKIRQASFMRDIYEKALKVMVFIGNSSPDSDMALNLLNRLAKGPSVSSRVAATKETSQVALKSLFESPCFSRLWVTHEIALARNLEILCGNRSEVWPSWSSLPNILRSRASVWLFNRETWSGFVRTDLQLLLYHALTHDCSDPRDKIFAVLGLLNKPGISPDYNLPVEVIYTGITAYLLKNCLDFRPLNLLGTGKRGSNLPSWVPDWSQPLSPSIPIDLEYGSTIIYGPEDVINVDFPIRFYKPEESRTEPGHVMEVDADGTLIISAVKLCDISATDKVILGPERRRIIVVNRGRQGNLLVALVDKEYEIGSDSVFLLNESARPVILRDNQGTNTYSFVSVCGISLVKPENGAEWYVPCGIDEYDWPIRVSLRLSSGSNNAILDFHASLLELCGVERRHASEAKGIDPTATARMSVLDFGLFTLTNFRTIESRLRDKWRECHEDLRWMFRDQTTVWKFIRDMDQGSQEDFIGVGSMVVEEEESLKQNYTIHIQTEYKWDLRKFFWSFLKPVTMAPKELEPDSAWNPVYKALKAHITKIQTWAAVTEQLMNAIDFSRAALGSGWDVFPGVDLPNKWHSKWESFSKTRGADGILSENESFSPECYWDWFEFERCLELRETLLAQNLPPALTIASNLEVKSHMILKGLGLHLDPMTIIKIV